MKKLEDFNENDEDFSLIDLYPKYVINSKGILKDFDITYIARSINRETGLEFETCEKIAQEVLRKIIGQGLKRVSSTYIREIVCLELTARGLEKFRNIYARYINISMTKFSLDEDFIEKFKKIHPKWGPLGYITYKRTYARYIEKENRKEEFWETLKRVVEGCFSIQKEHCVKLGLPWSEDKAQKSAQIMYQKMWDFKFIAPGRGLWIMGTPFIDRHGSMALNNCGFASTEDIDIKGTIPFEWTMDALMLGVGVGFDTKGAGKIIIKKPKEDDFLFRIPDSREGWVEALKYTLEAYFFGKPIPKLDYSLIRPAGELIRGFGGIASGPEPLEKMIENVKDLLDQRIGDKLRSIDIVDIMNFIGKCVVAGNVRRCIEENQRVSTLRGSISIKQIKITDKVLTSDGKYRKVKKNFKQGKQKILEISTPNGSLLCTPNHKVAIYNGLKSYKWRFAFELSTNDRLISVIHTKGNGNLLDVEKAWLIGFYIGDGYADIESMKRRVGGGGTVSFAMSTQRYKGNLGNKLIKILKKLGYNPNASIQGTYTHVNVYRKDLAVELLKYKKPKSIPIIPESIWRGTKEIRGAFLAGLADADGGKRNILLNSKYNEFCKQIQKLSLSLGIPTFFHKRPKRSIKGRNKKYEGCNYLAIRGIQSQMNAKKYVNPYATVWKSEIKNSKKSGLSLPYQLIIDAKKKGNIDFNITAGGFIRPSKTDQIGEVSTVIEHGKLVQKVIKKYRDANFDTLVEKNLVNPNWMPIEIVDIKPAGTAETYDIEVEDDHEFICEGFLVHNSAEIALGDINDTEFITMKQDKEKLTSHRWASNNSIFAKIGMDYSFVAEQIAKNGEPGVLWLENSRAYSRMAEPPDYKDKKVAGVNPCGEQSLESYELCVRGNTRVHIKHGCYLIKNLKDKIVEVWNGEEWSATTVQMTSPSAELVRVYFSDGSYIDTTKYHEFQALGKTKIKPVKKKPEELVIGDKMPEWSLGEIECKAEQYAYEYGLMIGDGYIDKGRNHEWPMLLLYDSKKELQKAGIYGKWYKEQISQIHKKPYARVNMKDVLNLNRCRMLRKNEGLEDWVFKMDKKSILEFVAGWIDSDGNVEKNPNTENYRIFGTEKNIRDLQILLRRIGINHASIRLMSKKGEKLKINNREVTRKKDIWYCTIPSYECGEIPTRLKKINPDKIGSRYDINNAHPNGKKIDRARKQKVIKIEYLGIKEPVYCFNEPKRHMGVFGNVLTYQCCLVESFPSNHESYEEFQDTLKYAYLYAKSVTLLNTHWKQTNAIMGKNRRIGTSQSGIINAFVKHGRREIYKWCEKGYNYLKELDSKYSDWLTTPKSIKMTSIKPSGTVSLLPGVTPGIHYPHSEYYIRRIRFNENSDLLPFLREAGYEIHTDKYSPNTSVVEFPIHEEYFERAKKDVSMWEQLENAAAYQKYWADNQVSITVTFKEKEAKDIKIALEIFEDKLKGVTFLPLNEHGYEQAPYEEITQEQYHEMKSKLKPLNLSTVKSEALGERFCDADFCEIKFK